MIVPILLVVGCLAVLVLEVFLVSFGALSLIAIAMGVTGVVLGFQESAELGWSMVAVLFVGVPSTLWGAFRILPKLPFARGLYLHRPELTERERHAATVDFSHLVGATGQATSPLRPAGTASFDGEPVAVVTNGLLLPAGTAVRVLDVTGNRVVVEEAKHLRGTAPPG